MVKEFHHMTGFLIRRLQQIALSVFEQKLLENNLDVTPAQCAVLHAIQLYPGVDQSTLAGIVAYDRATTGGIIRRLCEKGYAVQQPSPVNHRSKVLEITPAGEQLLDNLLAVVEDVNTNLLAGLSEREANQFRKLLLKVTETSNHLSRAPLVIPPELSS